MRLDGIEVVGRGRGEEQRAPKPQRGAPVPAPEHVHRNPEQISGRIFEHSHVVPSFEHADERFLGDLFGLVPVPGDQAECRKQAPERALVELLEARRRLAYIGLLGRSCGHGSQEIRLHLAP